MRNLLFLTLLIAYGCATPGAETQYERADRRNQIADKRKACQDNGMIAYPRNGSPVRKPEDLLCVTREDHARIMRAATQF